MNFPAFTALITPKRIPKPSQITPAPIASERVAGRSRLISSTTLICWE